MPLKNCWKRWVYSCLNDQVYLPTFSCAFFGRLVGKLITNSSILWELLTKPPPQGWHFHPSVPLNRHAQAFASEPDMRLACLDAGARMLAPGVKAVKPALAKVRLGAPIWGGSNKQQIHGNFEGFLLNNKQQIYEFRGMFFWWKFTLLGTNISPEKSILKMIFLFPKWDMLIPWRVPVLHLRTSPSSLPRRGLINKTFRAGPWQTYLMNHIIPSPTPQVYSPQGCQWLGGEIILQSKRSRKKKSSLVTIANWENIPTWKHHVAQTNANVQA